MNFENLGIGIVENRAFDEKIWALKDFRGKMVFLGGSGVILEFLEWLEDLSDKGSGSCKIWGFFKDFVEF
jgi:hypothetical protein